MRSHGLPAALPVLRSALSALACLAAAACSEPPAAHSVPAGQVDPRPISAFGDYYQFDPPEVDGSAFDPNEGLGVQGFADRRIGRRVSDFAVHKVVYGQFVDALHFFYPEARVGPGPGLCRAKAYSANGEPSSLPRGEWQEDVFAVAGSVAPLPQPWPRGYRARLDSACRARRDMALWYSAPADRAYLAARLADSVVASAKRKGPLPFRLECLPWPSGSQGAPRCSGDVRKAVASANPRAIVRVQDCPEDSERPCLSVGLAQRPERGPAAAEDQWTLNVRYRSGTEAQIVRVDVDDTIIDFE